MALTSDTRRRTEIYIAGKLQSEMADLGIPFIPYSGSDEGKAFDIDPPVGVIYAGDSEKELQQENTYMLKCSVQLVTHMIDTKVGDHSSVVQRIENFLPTIPSGSGAAYSFHGIDLDKSEVRTSDDGHHRADIIRFVAAVSGAIS